MTKEKKARNKQDTERNGGQGTVAREGEGNGNGKNRKGKVKIRK